MNISYRHIYKEKTHVVGTSSSRKYVSSLEKKKVLFYLVAENHQKRKEWRVKRNPPVVEDQSVLQYKLQKMSLMEYNTLCASVEKTMHI